MHSEAWCEAEILHNKQEFWILRLAASTNYDQGCMKCVLITLCIIHEGKDHLQSGCKLKGKKTEIQPGLEPGSSKLHVMAGSQWISVSFLLIKQSRIVNSLSFFSFHWQLKQSRIVNSISVLFPLSCQYSNLICAVLMHLLQSQGI